MAMSAAQIIAAIKTAFFEMLKNEPAKTPRMKARRIQKKIWDLCMLLVHYQFLSGVLAVQIIY